VLKIWWKRRKMQFSTVSHVHINSTYLLIIKPLLGSCWWPLYTVKTHGMQKKEVCMQHCRKICGIVKMLVECKIKLDQLDLCYLFLDNAL
jgi:hypothetical protein